MRESNDEAKYNKSTFIKYNKPIIFVLLKYTNKNKN